MLASKWIEFWEHKTELFYFSSLTDETDNVVNSTEYKVPEAQDELTIALNDKV